MREFQYIYIEQHDDQSLIKLKRSDETVAGITAQGVVVTIKGATDDLTDDEMLELLSIPTKPNRPPEFDYTDDPKYKTAVKWFEKNSPDNPDNW